MPTLFRAIVAPMHPWHDVAIGERAPESQFILSRGAAKDLRSISAVVGRQ